MTVIYQDSKVEFYGGLVDLPFNFAQVTAEIYQDGIKIESTGTNQLSRYWIWVDILDISVNMTSALHGAECRGHVSPSDLENYVMLREAGHEPAPGVSILVGDSESVRDVRLVFRNLEFARIFVSVAYRIQHSQSGPPHSISHE